MATLSADALLKNIETPEEWLKICGDENFARDMLYVVEVYASWCGQSQAATSTYRKIIDANEQKKFKLCKVCADLVDELENPKAAAVDLSKYKINPRPTFILIKDGEMVGIVEGVSMPTLEKCVRDLCTRRDFPPLPTAPSACARARALARAAPPICNPRRLC